MLAATGRMGALIILPFAGVLAAGWLIDSGKLHWSLSSRIANWLLIGYLPLAFLGLQILRLSPVSLIVYSLIFLTSLKLLRIKTNRDWLWLYIASFCQVIITAGMMIGTTFLLLLIFYLFAAISTFVSNEIYRSQQSFAANFSARNVISQPPSIEYYQEDENTRRQLAMPRWRSLTYFSAGVLVLILFLAVPIFLLMPRLTRGFSRNSLLVAEKLTGFSDTVRLGDVAQIKLNSQVVMRVRVKFARDVGKPILRWRGVTLDHYDGETWSESGMGPEPLKKFAESFRVDEKLSPYGFTYQHFFVEPLDINTIFVAPRPIYVTGLRNLARDSGDGLWSQAHAFHKIDYHVASDTKVPSDTELSADNTRVYPLETKRRYLQLPINHDRRIDDLAAEVTRGAITQLEIARRIEEHLRTSYNYTLDLQRVEDGDPVADFLFNVRAGHCEYFASAMVLMLRSRRVPARIVNGFQMGEYNNSADVYTVRQSDAHSWVEVFFPKQGWIAFDPTPPSGLSVYDDGLTAWLRHYGEAIEMFWLEHIVGFDTGKQLSMALTVQRWLWSYQRNASSRWFDWASDLAQKVDAWRMSWRGVDERIIEGGRSSNSLGRMVIHPISLMLLGLTVLLVTALIWRKHNLSWRRNIGRDASISAIAFYQEMLRSLESAGYKREPYQTPSEFAAQLTRPDVSEITHLYQRTRFGNEKLNDQEVARIDILLRELKKQERIRNL